MSAGHCGRPRTPQDSRPRAISSARSHQATSGAAASHSRTDAITRHYEPRSAVGPRSEPNYPREVIETALAHVVDNAIAALLAAASTASRGSEAAPASASTGSSSSIPRPERITRSTAARSLRRPASRARRSQGVSSRSGAVTRPEGAGHAFERPVGRRRADRLVERGVNLVPATMTWCVSRFRFDPRLVHHYRPRSRGAPPPPLPRPKKSWWTDFSAAADRGLEDVRSDRGLSRRIYLQTGDLSPASERRAPAVPRSDVEKLVD